LFPDSFRVDEKEGNDGSAQSMMVGISGTARWEVGVMKLHAWAMFRQHKSEEDVGNGAANYLSRNSGIASALFPDYDFRTIQKKKKMDRGGCKCPM
jgi:hypothetical protein